MSSWMPGSSPAMTKNLWSANLSDEQALVQFRLHIRDALRDQIVGDLAFDTLRQDFSGGGDGRFGGGGADIGYGLRFGLANFRLGHLGAARDELFHLGSGFDRESLSFGLGAGDDVGGFTLGVALFALI